MKPRSIEKMVEFRFRKLRPPSCPPFPPHSIPRNKASSNVPGEKDLFCVDPSLFAALPASLSLFLRHTASFYDILPHSMIPKPTVRRKNNRWRRVPSHNPRDQAGLNIRPQKLIQVRLPGAPPRRLEDFPERCLKLPRVTTHRRAW